MENRSELATFGEAFSALARSVGLWNYIDTDIADARDELAAEVAGVPELGIVLHREQLSALNVLLGAKISFSAPPRVLVRAFWLMLCFFTIVIGVSPSCCRPSHFSMNSVDACETIRRRYDVLMHHSESATRDRVIFLGTQERLINREDLGRLDLVVVDEFYKLDPARKDERSVTLNAAVYRLLNRAKQFFFLGPNIDNVTISAKAAGNSRFYGPDSPP